MVKLKLLKFPLKFVYFEIKLFNLIHAPKYSIQENISKIHVSCFKQIKMKEIRLNMSVYLWKSSYNV
jgi:hypothetical protein